MHERPINFVIHRSRCAVNGSLVNASIGRWRNHRSIAQCAIYGSVMLRIVFTLTFFDLI